MFGSVAADVDRTGTCNGISREVAVAQTHRAAVERHIKQIALGGLRRAVSAERHETVANNREIAVDELIVLRNRLVFAHKDEVTAVSNSHAACNIDDLLEADAVVEHIGVRYAVGCGLLSTADIERIPIRMRLCGVGERFTGKDRIGAAEGFFSACRTSLDAVGKVNIEVLRCLTVEGHLQAAFDPCALMAADREIVCIELGENIGNDACGVDRIVKGNRTPAELNALADGILHIAHARCNLHAFHINQIARRIGINFKSRMVDFTEDLIQRGRERTAQQIHGLFVFSERDGSYVKR